MEEIEWNNCLWKSNYNDPILRNEPLHTKDIFSYSYSKINPMK